MTRARTHAVLVALAAIACRPSASEPVASAPPEPAPAPAPAQPPAPADPPAATPVDPLAGLDADAQWKWAVDRLPQLASLETAPTGSLDLLVADGSKITLHSPDVSAHAIGMFASKPCTPMTFARTGDSLVTRVPLRQGPARPDIRDRYTELELGTELVVGAMVDGDQRGMIGLPQGHQSPRRSAVEPDVLRYQARLQRYRVDCAWHTEERRCADGKSQMCRRCDPVLSEIHFHVGSGSMGLVKSCETCPPTGEQIAKALDRVIHGRDFAVVDASYGPAFFREKLRCRAAEAAMAAEAAETAIGDPVPEKLYDVVVSFISPGDGTNREAADALQRFVVGVGPTLEHARGRWGKEGEHDECFDLSGLDAKARKRFLSFVKSLAKKPKVQLGEKATCRDEPR